MLNLDLPQRSCSLFSVKYWLFRGRSHVYVNVNVKQGRADKGHVCFLAQINKASASPAVSPLRIPTCLSGLLVPKSPSLLLSPDALISAPLSAYWWCLPAGLVVHWWRWDWISWWVSVFSYKLRYCRGCRSTKSCRCTRESWISLKKDKCALLSTQQTLQSTNDAMQTQDPFGW